MNRLSMLYKIVLLALTVFKIAVSAYGQGLVESANTLLEQKIEALIENSEQEPDISSIFEQLYFYEQNPLNLNTATAEELKSLIVLSPFQIESILQYIKDSGAFLTIYELQGVKGLDMETIRAILPYVTVEQADIKEKTQWKRMVRNGQHQVLFRYQQVLEPQQGFLTASEEDNPDSRYLGSPAKIYSRWKYSYKNTFRAGITADKDAGEEFFKGSQKNGFDFYSAHLFVSSYGKIRSLAVGDYHIRFGQGLIAWSGFSFGKSSDALNIQKLGKGVSPYSSTDENRFLRGIATTVELGRFDLTGFVSSKKVDATALNYSADSSRIVSFNSLDETGLHATPSSLTTKDAVKERTGGANIRLRGNTFHIGATAVFSEFNPGMADKVSLYNQFEFCGTHSNNYSIDYSWHPGKVSFFGEAATSLSKGKAFIQGISLHPDQRLRLALLYRSIDKSFYALHSSAFTENSKGANEKGFYAGVGILPAASWSVTAYYDQFRFPWLKFGVDAPSRGSEYLLEVKHNLSGNTSCYLRFREKTKQTNKTNSNDNTHMLETTKKQSLRFLYIHELNSNIRLKGHVEVLQNKVINQEPRYGYLLYQDISCSHRRVPLRVTFRYALFDTDSYDERIYAYENDVLYAFSVPAYYYKGSRAYLLIKYAPSKNLSFWLKVSQTYYSNKTTISSGLNKINGNTKSKIKMQVRYKF